MACLRAKDVICFEGKDSYKGGSKSHNKKPIHDSQSDGLFLGLTQSAHRNHGSAMPIKWDKITGEIHIKYLS